MKAERRATPKRARARHRSSRLPWLAAVVLAGLIATLGGVYVWADQQARGEVDGELVAANRTQDVGTVPYSGGLARASFALQARGGPVVVDGISTT